MSRAAPETVARFESVAELALGIRTQTFSSRALVEQCLARIAAVDDLVQAWVSVDSRHALAEADQCDREAREGRTRGPLHGIPLAVKDIIDVAGWPTRAGSRTRLAAAPALADAGIVALARAAGAIVLGKTHTTEFACYEREEPFLGAPPTRNPYSLERSPGGSSSGSAAAVAAGMVPLALGSQTGGSLTRPASFCGVAAFKPSVGAVAASGVTPFAPTFDTVGTMGAGIADAITLFKAIAPPFLDAGLSAEPDRLFLLDDPLYGRADKEVSAAREEWAASLRVKPERISSPVALASVLEFNKVIVSYEIGRVFKTLISTQYEMIGENLAKSIVEGASVTDEAYFHAMRGLAALRREFWNSIGLRNAIIIPPAQQTAPEGLWTGDPSFATSMTVLGGPMAAIPHKLSSNGLPLGVVIASAPGTDLGLASMLLRLETQRIVN